MSSPGHVRRLARISVVAICTLLVVVVGVSGYVTLAFPDPATVASSPDRDTPAAILTTQPKPVAGPVQVTGDPAALPGILLIADRGNSRLIEVDGRGDIQWEFPPPGYTGSIKFDQTDDAFYGPDGRSITTNQEFEHTVQRIDRNQKIVTFHYGTPYQAGSGAHHLNGPDDAYLLADGRMVTADIKNCRIVFIEPDSSVQTHGQPGQCRHDPAHGYFSSPNGDAPSPDGEHIVISEIGGNWVNVFTLPDFRYEYSFRSPARYVSDAIMQGDGSFIMTDYVDHGAVYRTDDKGRLLWKYDTDLNHPSIAIGLPNGLVAIADDFGDRVIIVDPSTNSIKWQYGVKNVPGATSGHLYIPDGLDFRFASAWKARPGA